ncbi:MAG: hypothetical protein IKQ35_00390 [Bacilli bacterium]|nr:hypothetical protein [Bacilli bacterium]
MDYNIVLKYISFIKREYLEFFNILFRSKYQKKIFEEFIDTYISVRYFNETNFRSEKDFMARINKELIKVYERLKNDNDENLLKNTVALFVYIVYFDDIYEDENSASLIDDLIQDENIQISNKEALHDELLNWYLELKDNKNKFHSMIATKEFSINKKRVDTKTYEVTLDHNVKISNLYSDYAVTRAFKSPIVSEDKEFVISILTSHEVLKNAINLEFTKRYIFELVPSIVEKEKKLKRLFSCLDNPLTKRYISAKITYEEYLNNKSTFDSYIVDGYSFAVVLDSKFQGNIKSLVLFSFIYITEDNEYYDEIMKAKKELMPKIIVY